MTISVPNGHHPGTSPGRELSAAERRIWFDRSRTRAGSDSGILCSVVSFDGLPDVSRLREAMAGVWRRHEVLTSTHHVGPDGEPYLLRSEVEPEWIEHDLTALDPAAAERRIEVVRQRLAVRPFELADQAPLRVAVLRVDADRHVMIVAAHAIAWDDDSLGILLHDVASELDNRAHTIDSAPTATSGIGAADIGFWQTELADLPDAALNPGAQNPMTPGPAASGESVTATIDVDPALLWAADEYARRRRMSLVDVLMAAHSAFLLRCTGITDLVTTVPAATIAARTLAAHTPMSRAAIGQYGNAILVRSHPDPGATFDDQVSAVAATLDRVARHLDDGLDDVLEATRPARGAHGLTRVSRVGFAVHPAVPAPGPVVSAASHAGAATIRVIRADRPKPPVPWHLAVELDGIRPQVRMTMTGSDAESATETGRRYLTLLAGAIAEPATTLGRLPLLPPERRDAVLAAAYGPRASHPPTTLCAVVERIVATRPQRPALIADRAGTVAEIAYREMNARANRVARQLISSGVGTEVVVGLRMPPSVEFVVAALAVLKAGGAYLPIDPGYPAERVRTLTDDAKPALVWDADDLRGAETAGRQLDSADITDADRLRPLRPDNLAYVMYTSGSTGTPKGVPVAHAAIADHVLGFIAQWPIPSESRVLLTSSVGFDASFLDIFVTLSAGASIVVPDPRRARDLGYLAALIADRRVTLLHLVPSLLRELVMLPHRAEWHALTHVAVGGDRLPGEVADRALSTLDVELRNYYGPTEAVVSATHHPVVPASGHPIEPIGRPNTNVDAHVLDDRLEVVADGLVGELYLGGKQLARGYLDRAAMTAAHFVADPFGVGGRLYRTGDLVRRNRSGVLEFIGRADDQVKIRGHRIELGEVTATLLRHPDVDDCLVCAAPTADGDNAVHAYLVTANPDALDVAAVRRFAAHQLPEVMVPTAFATLASLPRTAAGKVDAASLPSARPVGAGIQRRPRSVTETRVANLYAEFFGVDDVYADDSFFDLGGHSLTAHRFLAALREHLGVRLDVEQLYGLPTVTGVADTVDATRGRRPGFDVAGRSDDALIEPTAAQILAVRRGTTHVVCAMTRLRGPIDPEALTAAVIEVAGRHDAMRLTTADATSLTFTVLDGVELEVDLTGPPDAPGRVLAVDLTPGAPLWRIRLRGSAEAPTLEVFAHRAAGDEFSVRAIVAEIADTYSGRGHSPVSGRFGDYARWYAATATADAASIAWWRSAYDGLPLTRRVTTITQPQVSASITVAPGIRRRAQAVAVGAGLSESALYAAATAVVAHRLGHAAPGDDLLLGTLTGRESPSSATLIGPLTAPAVLRYDLSGDLRLTSVLDQARFAAHGADTAVDVPVEVHRTVALADLPGEPALAATIRFIPATPDTVRFGDTLADVAVADVPAPDAPAPDGVLVTCRPVDGTIAVTAAAPADRFGQDEIGAWTTTIGHVLDQFVTASDRRLSELFPAADPTSRGHQ
ncbi:amino acid adenylation domain-containing protein [Gordonia bronchialis]|uniref:non-ribosomal peptide synthetase n=1 Tax=Gordonia bronchialis TaxID=2054 RepID=UPI001CBB7A20|nr:non-ribosomal peptide synthetase [Gordonia bronchialis]UAK37430.1 amino acid adenylation domain-containing protein [Gordonia bronchialis]